MMKKLLFLLFTLPLFYSCHSGEIKSYQKRDIITTDTLDNKVDKALNFYIDNGTLMCNASTRLSIMSMPPNGDGLNTFFAGESFEVSGMTLIKVDSINFVISDFKIID